MGTGFSTSNISLRYPSSRISLQAKLFTCFRRSSQLRHLCPFLPMRWTCGFCAQSSLNGACSVRSQSGKAISTCSRAYDFKISPASKISKQKACTNVPIQCKFCPNVHWKYNMHRHLQERHPSWERNVTTGASELNEFREKITITSEEENRLKIPESKQGWSTVIYTDVYDLRRLDRLPSTHDGRADSPRRPTRKQTSFMPPLPPISLPILPRLNYTSCTIAVQMYFPRLLIVYNLSFQFTTLLERS
jgi:hypothetical protein